MSMPILYAVNISYCNVLASSFYGLACGRKWKYVCSCSAMLKVCSCGKNGLEFLFVTVCMNVSKTLQTQAMCASKYFSNFTGYPEDGGSRVPRKHWNLSSKLIGIAPQGTAARTSD